jgi:TetR/AcrR family transcriptional repressor of bet genes
MPRPENTEERRAQIAQGLQKVMAKKGYDGASISDVAKEAGLAPGLVHYHFKNKLEILLVVLDRLGAHHLAELDARIAEAYGDPQAELVRFIEHHLATGKTADAEALACWISLGGEALKDARVRRAYAAVLEASLSRLRAIIAQGAASGVFEIRAPDAAAAGLLAAIQGYFVLAGTARSLIPRKTAAKTVIAMAAGLLGAPPPPLKRRKR